MATPIIRSPSDLAEYFDNVPSRTYGRQSSYKLEVGMPLQSTGYSAIKRAAERINQYGDNLAADEIMSFENWDLVNEW